MPGTKKAISAKLKDWLWNEAGVVAIVFAMSLPMIIGAAGLAVDLAQAYNVKNRLADALDKATLAAGSTDGTSSQIQARVSKFFNANYPVGQLGTPYDLNVIIGSDGIVTVSARASVPTTFMSALGLSSIDVYAQSGVKRELAGVEAVLVLDVTGSMNNSLGSVTKITALKNAVYGTSATDPNSFLNIVFSRIPDPTYIKIGIVPFSDTVNVGPYGLGVDPTGTAYGTGFVSRPATDDYVTPPSNITYKAPASSTTNWWGCITERASPADTNDSSSPNWGMYRYPKICSHTTQTCTHQTCTKMKNGVCQTYTCDTYTSTCTSYSNNDPNTACTQSMVVPLTSSKSILQNAIKTLIVGGNTYGNVGMVWGYHLMTPAAPFTEGVALNDEKWTKTVIFMSDGDNTVNTTYAAYGANSPLTVANLNSNFLATCNNMKQAGISIYTISFGVNVSSATQTMFSQCASDPGKYFNSTTGTDLGVAFKTIADQLSQLHIIN
jgi:Flp pilus assembly protein TadG